MGGGGERCSSAAVELFDRRGLWITTGHADCTSGSEDALREGRAEEPVGKEKPNACSDNIAQHRNGHRASDRCLLSCLGDCILVFLVVDGVSACYCG